jgi:glycosyltransferase involved in cell wall biosynthesis
MTQPTTILHLINVGGPGGAESVCVNLARGLDQRRWRSLVVVPDRGWIHHMLEDAGVETVVLGHASRFDVVRHLGALSKLVRQRGVALIQSHLFGPSCIASLLGLVHRLPVVGTIHGEGDLDPGESFRRAKFGLLNNGLTRLVFVSEPLRRFFLGTGLLRSSMTTVIPNGIDVDAYSRDGGSQLRGELGVGDEEFLVGALGNLRPAKAYDVLLRAAAILSSSEPGYRFVVAGQWEGELADELTRLRDDLGLRDVVALAGFRADAASVLAALDLYLLTSRSEGFSLSVVEAMASGLPIVSTRCGGPEQILADGVAGVLVPNGSSEAVAEAIAALRADPAKRARMGRVAKAVARSRFTVESQVWTYERLYEECLAGTRRPRARGALHVEASTMAEQT